MAGRPCRRAVSKSCESAAFVWLRGRGACVEAVVLGALWLVVALVVMQMLANSIAHLIDGARSMIIGSGG